METLKNKVYAAILLALGALSVTIDGDATGLVFLSFIAIPLFFAKRNWVF